MTDLERIKKITSLLNEGLEDVENNYIEDAKACLYHALALALFDDASIDESYR